MNGWITTFWLVLIAFLIGIVFYTWHTFLEI